jgi:hypothetical protein
MTQATLRHTGSSATALCHHQPHPK